MPESKEYRAYSIDRDGHIMARFDLLATDEATAREQASLLVDGHDIELWQGAVKVAKFNYKPPS